MKVSRSALLPYSVDQMYDVVADIPSYPAFLSWCEDSQVIRESDNEVIAKLVISYAKLSFEFTTRNNNIKNQSIELNLVDGPFTSLSGIWKFQALNEQGCKVSIDMDFDFDNPIAKKMFGKMFSKIVSTQLDAFQSRAKVLYGVNK